MERLLSVKEVSVIFGCKPHLVYKLMRHHGLPSVKISERLFRFRLSDVEQYLKERQNKVA